MRWKIKIFRKKKFGQYFQKMVYIVILMKLMILIITKIISAKLLPDEAIFVISKNTVYIIEKKHRVEAVV